MSERYLHHVTLTSGHVRHSPRSEVRDDVLTLLAPLLDRALSGEPVPVPGVTGGYTITGGAEGRCCTLTVWAPGRVPVVTIGVATHSRCGAGLWRLLHDHAVGMPVATTRDQVPPEPWYAARLEVGALQHRDAAAWCGDFERCLAWCWIERNLRTREDVS